MEKEYLELFTKMYHNIMRDITYNKILLAIVLSQLGLKDKEIDKINESINSTLDKVLFETEEK